MCNVTLLLAGLTNAGEKLCHVILGLNTYVTGETER